MARDDIERTLAAILSADVVGYSRLMSENEVETEPALPDKLSVAVLPFANMSGDPEKEYFADGITEGGASSGSSKACARQA